MSRATPSVVPCNICGSTVFGPGPGGRKAADGSLPQCKGCQSLERHRALREMYRGLAGRLAEEFSRWDVLQFSEDRAVDSRLFSSVEVSTYGGSNHLDLQEISRESGSYHWVICNHVLEHVPDDRRAMRELWRICSAEGAIQFAVPDPPRRESTSDWGYPKESDHDHYRIYGRDVFDRAAGALWDCFVLELDTRDPTTGHIEAAYIGTRSDRIIEAAAADCHIRRLRRVP